MLFVAICMAFLLPSFIIKAVRAEDKKKMGIYELLACFSSAILLGCLIMALGRGY